MLKLPAIFNRKRRAAEESDFGRRFGWFIERDGERIGELDYVRWDSHAQFWHEYRLTWRRPEDAVIGPDAWIAAKLVLRAVVFPMLWWIHFSLHLSVTAV